jgi:hypothetical protein
MVVQNSLPVATVLANDGGGASTSYNRCFHQCQTVLSKGYIDSTMGRSRGLIVLHTLLFLVHFFFFFFAILTHRWNNFCSDGTQKQSTKQKHVVVHRSIYIWYNTHKYLLQTKLFLLQ